MSETVAPVKGTEKPRRGLERAVIRFAGDSGDGMQLTGEQFTTESAWAGNDIATLPNFPAGMSAGTHTFVAHGFTPCSFAVSTFGYPGPCTNPNAVVEAVTLSMTVTFQ